MEYKGYHGTIRYDSEEEVFHGKVVGIRDFILFESETVGGLEKEFRFSIDDYLEWCEESGKPPSKPFTGVFVAHIAPETHRAAVFAAYKSGESFDDWIEKAVRVAIAETKATNIEEQPETPNRKALNGPGDDDADYGRKTLSGQPGSGEEPLLREGGDG